MAEPMVRPLDPAAVRYGADGLVAAVVQDVDDGRVLMVAWQDAEAIAATQRTGLAHFHSRSRDALWMKGETSGNTLAVVSLELDCDADAVLIHVRPVGPACHTGARSCFDVSTDTAAPGAAAAAAGDAAHGAAGGPPGMGLDAETGSQDFAWLERLWSTIEERARTRPEGSYTSRLLAGGVDATGRKVAEEATEVLMAAKDDAVAERLGTARPTAELAGELADLFYHTLVLCAERGLAPREVMGTLQRRHRG